MGTEPKRILVIQTAFLGDVVLTTPLLSALRDRFPDAHLAVLVIPGTREILEGGAVLNEVLVHDKKGRERGIRGILAAARRLKEKRFDLCLLPHRSFRSTVIAFLSGIPRRIGFLQSPGFFLCTRRVRWERSRHEVRRNLELLRPLGIDPAASSGKLWVSWDGSDSDQVDRRFSEYGIMKNDRVVGIAPGSVWATKRWTPEGFAAVVDALIARYHRKVLLLGSRDDAPVVEAVMARCKEKPVNFAGRTTLRQLAAALKRCELLITNDNGAMHVGAAQGVPIVAVFGSTTLGLGYGPYTDRASVVERSLNCRPCGKHGHAKCPLGHFNCMKQIGPEEVMEAAEKQLALNVNR